MGRPASLAGHINIDANGAMRCSRCNGEHKLVFPLNARKIITLIESYMELHRDCPDPKQASLPVGHGG
jgi:hypothetical protein